MFLFLLETHTHPLTPSTHAHRNSHTERYNDDTSKAFFVVGVANDVPY